MEQRIPCTIMRGGTSRAVFFRHENLPEDVALQDCILLAAMGSPDPSGRQIDGLGGATSSTSKVAIIGKRKDEPNTILYTFCQVDIKSKIVDRKGNCGNISSAVGPYAIDEGLVEGSEPETMVRIYNTNTRKYIIAHVPVKQGKAMTKGDYQISGIPGTGARIALDFEFPGGSTTGSLLPTGRPQEILDTPVGRFLVSIVDAATPCVFVRAKDMGLQGTELGSQVDSDRKLLEQLENIRIEAAVRIGLACDLKEASEKSLSVPKIAFVSPPSDYLMTYGTVMPAKDIDVVCRMISMGKLHGAYPITGAIGTAGAAHIPGTVVSEMLSPDRRQSPKIRIGHPCGSVTVNAIINFTTSDINYTCGTVYRTARRIMDGYVYIPESVFDESWH